MVKSACSGAFAVYIRKDIYDKRKSKNGFFFCKECGYESPKWMGQCPACKAWNAMTEESVQTGKGSVIKKNTEKTVPVVFSDVTTEEELRITSGYEELDRVLGGGIVRGSLVLVGGDPGIGKSTLLLQMCRKLDENENSILYVSGEESLKQIKMRADRLGKFNGKMKLLCDTDLTSVSEVIENEKPEVVIIDSIQTMVNQEISGSAGSISQVRESTAILLNLAKRLSVTIFIVGHVTKEGTVAGPRLLEHMVDTVLYFEGDRYASYRILRAVKNRFGSTNEIGVFEMQEDGLKEVKNPSEYMLEGRVGDISGTVTTCAMEGTRPILLEIQALCCQTGFGIPRRQTSGADLNRVNLLMAVLEKRLGLHLGACDAYVNVAGGMKINEPSIDLGIVIAIISSFINIPIPEKLIAVGEVGLGGEIRNVGLIEQRVQEAVKMGFDRIIIPRTAYERTKGIAPSALISVSTVTDVLKIIKSYGKKA